MCLKRLVPATLLAITALSTAACHSEFEIQSYELPDKQGYRHMTALIRGSHDELILFGGLGNGPPLPPTAVNHALYTLDLKQDPSEQQWKHRATDGVIGAPWFTSTRGFIEVGDKYYMACDDSNVDKVYSFDPDHYKFSHVSTSTLALERQGGDCCAVGVTLPETWHHRAEERIYILGGRNDLKSPLSQVRYYSITHDKWGVAENMKLGRSHLGCVAAKKHRKPVIYAIAGGNSPKGEALNSIEVYDVLRDKWELHENFLPSGRTRLGVQNIDDKYLMLIGGDASCAGGGADNKCKPDHPITTIDVIAIEHRLKLFSAAHHFIPQLNVPRQTPATALRKGRYAYEIYVIGGRTLEGDKLGCATTTEVLSFDRHLLALPLR